MAESTAITIIDPNIQSPPSNATMANTVFTTVDVPWMGDFSVDLDGRILLVFGDTAYVQRMLRRMLTGPRLVDEISGFPVAPSDYIFEPNFGAGLRRMINQPISDAMVEEIDGLITKQIQADPETERSSGVRVLVFKEDTGQIQAQVLAKRSPTGTLAFTLNLANI